MAGAVAKPISSITNSEVLARTAFRSDIGYINRTGKDVYVTQSDGLVITVHPDPAYPDDGSFYIYGRVKCNRNAAIATRHYDSKLGELLETYLGERGVDNALVNFMHQVKAVDINKRCFVHECCVFITFDNRIIEPLGVTIEIHTGEYTLYNDLKNKWLEDKRFNIKYDTAFNATKFIFSNGDCVPVVFTVANIKEAELASIALARQNNEFALANLKYNSEHLKVFYELSELLTKEFATEVKNNADYASDKRKAVLDTVKATPAILNLIGILAGV